MSIKRVVDVKIHPSLVGLPPILEEYITQKVTIEFTEKEGVIDSCVLYNPKAIKEGQRYLAGNDGEGHSFFPKVPDGYTMEKVCDIPSGAPAYFTLHKLRG
jgi:hypothetical protein